MKLLAINLQAKLRATFRIPAALLVSLLLAPLAQQAFAQQPGATETTAVPALVQSDLSKRQEAFQIVWQTVNDLFYDPKFGGVDWAGVRERYEPLVTKVS
ncbi:MAG TPA: hypothetical protein VGO73_05385, partial [Pyrinomonadaceae bacterium]|nr:hypothetical protein [Pyrinomonadaceae bacterium]